MLGSVVQSINSLKKSLRCQLVEYVPFIKTNTVLVFCWKNLTLVYTRDVQFPMKHLR